MFEGACPPWSGTSKSTAPWSRIKKLGHSGNHHVSWRRAALVDRWPSCSQSGNRETSKVPPTSEQVATAHTCEHPTSNAVISLRKHCNTVHPSQSPSCGSVHPHFAGDVHASVTASDIEKERSCPTACTTSPMMVGLDRSFRTRTQGSPDHVPNKAQWRQHRSGARFRNSARRAQTRSVVWRPLPLSPAPAWK